MASPHFAVGDRVVIRDETPPAHHRVPAYVKGKAGVVERVCDAYGQPETLAIGESGKPLQTLYRVRLLQTALWKEYDASSPDTLEIEIFEHWLERNE